MMLLTVRCCMLHLACNAPKRTRFPSMSQAWQGGLQGQVRAHAAQNLMSALLDLGLEPSAMPDCARSRVQWALLVLLV